jgi:hypothetical protein
MRAYADVPTFEVTDKTSTHSENWYAGAITHDTYHSHLYHEAKGDSDIEPDPDKWTDKGAEEKCLQFQLEVLRELRADPDIIDYIETLTEDPTYQGDAASWEDYEKRDW